MSEKLWRGVCRIGGAWCVAAVVAAGVVCVGAAEVRGEVSAEERAAWALVRMGRMDLRAVGAGDERDFAVALAVLRAAGSLSPDDEEIMRLTLEAAQAAGDDGAVAEITRELVRRDPKDTVSVLRLVSRGISRLQSVEARLDAYDAMLGERGAGIDASVRSRLAMDAALLRREQGDERGFARMLAQAAALDSTNKDAAALALVYARDALADPVAEFELLQNLLLADPFDGTTHQEMALQLSRHGAFEGAMVSHDLARAIRSRRGEADPEGMQLARMRARWGRDGARRFVEWVQVSIDGARRQAALAIEEAERDEEGEGSEGLVRPEEIYSDPEVAGLCVVAAAATGDAGLVSQAVFEVGLSFAGAIRVIEKAIEDPEVSGELKRELGLRRQWLVVEWAWLRLWVGEELEAAIDVLDQIGEIEEGVNEAAKDRMAGFAMLRGGDVDGAESVLAGMAEDPSAQVGMALVLEARGDRAGAVAAYKRVAEAYPDSVAGLFSRGRVRASGEAEWESRGRVGDRLAALAGAMPGWIKSGVVDPGRTMTLSVKPVSMNRGLFERIELEVRLRNRAPVPLGLGAEGPLGSRLLLVPVARVGTESFTVSRAHETVSLARKLRLMPGEEMSVRVWSDSGYLGFVLDRFVRASAAVRYQVLQGFVSGGDGLYRKGAASLSVSTERVTRYGSAIAAGSGDVLEARIRGGSVADVLEGVAAVRARVVEAASRGEVYTEAERLLGSASGRFASLGAADQMMVVMLVPSRELSAASEGVVMQGARSEDARVVLATLVAHAGEGDEALFGAVRAEVREALGGVVEILEGRIAEGVGGFAADEAAVEVVRESEGG